MISFNLLDLTLPSPVENLALDEALLDDLEETEQEPILRLWESDRYFVVLGRSSPHEDVHLDVCRQDGIPVLRRASGGGTVLQGPGCLCYALVLPTGLHAHLRDIRLTNTFILRRMAMALSPWEPAIAEQGISDLTVKGRKIGGSAQKRKRNALLFHGTVLYGMRAGVIARYLNHPKQQPAYRGDRPHGDFLTTLDVPVQKIKQAIANMWHAHTTLDVWPRPRMSTAIENVVERSFSQAECISDPIALMEE